MLPFLALSTLGATGVSMIASATAQNPLAKYLYSKDIPEGAKPYPNIYELGRKHPSTNSSLLGYAACGAVIGATWIVGRITMIPVLPFLRRRYIYLPGTNFPRRITNIKEFLYDLSPDVIVNIAPFIPAFPLGFAAKVYLEGPGRFTGFSERYNPYTQIRQEHEELYIYDLDRFAANARAKLAEANATAQTH